MQCGFSAAPMGDGGLDRQALLDLATGRRNSRSPPGSGSSGTSSRRCGHCRRRSSGALSNTGAAMFKSAGSAKVRDGGHRGVGLEAELGAEPGRDVAVVVEVAALVPDRPEVHVAGAVVVPGVAEAHRAGRWARTATSWRAGPRLSASASMRAVQAVVGDEVAVAVGAAFGKPGQRAEQFVVAAPEREAGVVVQAGDDVANLGRRPRAGIPVSTGRALQANMKSCQTIRPISSQRS